jgi:ABC-2 type transport system ATP-binding protein
VDRSEKNAAVEVKELTKRFGSFTAVDRISFSVSQGEIFGFLGPNGAGKSTTIKMLCGILMPTSGAGSVGGFDILREQERIKENIGYMSQRFSLYDDLTVEENIEFYSGIYRIPEERKKERSREIIRMAGLEEMKKSLTRNLSGGWKQRLALGCAIIHEPKILFLDEPTSGVDPMTRANFWKMIKEMARGGVTVFVTTHYMDEAENCDRLSLIYRGAVIAMGTPEELKTQIMKDQILEISLPSPEDWLDGFLSLGVVKEAALFGSNIHIGAGDAAQASTAIAGMLEKGNVKGYSIRKIAPSLEDVFVSLIENHDEKNNGQAKRGEGGT